MVLGAIREMSVQSYSSVIENIENFDDIGEAYFQKRLSILREGLIGALGMTVVTGPFRGMDILVSPDPINFLPRLLGCYEQELHPRMESLISYRPDQLINIGCGEGYYAVGMALRVPELTVHAFDLDEESLFLCRQIAEQNGVANRVNLYGECTQESLSCLAKKGSVIICDCEGAELDLLKPLAVPILKECSLTVELHEFLCLGLAEELASRFDRTQAVQIVDSSGRNPHAFPFLRKFSNLDQWLVLCEFRSASMQWMVADPNDDRMPHLK